MPRKLEFTEWQKFWKRTILWEISRKWTQRVVRCKCDCWKEEWVNVSMLSQWRSKSCGCWIWKHWHTSKWKSRIYVTYTNILQRCYNPNHKSYKDYWAKWIKCERNSFEEFYKDMWDSYEEHIKQYWEYETTIDRIDSNWNYCKENCRWATHFEQSNHLSSNHKVIYKWKEYRTLTSLCKEYWIWVTTMNQRLHKYWWSLNKAVETPVKSFKKHFT